MNETQAGSAGAPDHGGRDRGGDGESTPLQGRANFLQNWDWASVTKINARLCLRGQAQHGINQETHGEVQKSWQEHCCENLTLLETFEFLRHCHRSAPFLFYNGNTFAEIGRTLAVALFSDLHSSRKKEISSAVAHFITGVLDRDSMISIVDSLCQTASFAIGDRVGTLRGSTRGTIRVILEDGRIVWRPDGTSIDLTGLPESLSRIED